MPRRKKNGRRGKGDGSVYQRADGKWVGQIDLGRDPDTSRRRRPVFYGDTKEEVQAQVRTALYQAERGEYIEKTNYTVHEWVTKYLNQFAKVKLRPTTWSQRLYVYNHYWKKAIGSISLQKLQTTHIQSLVAAWTEVLQPVTIRTLILSVRPAFTKAVELGLIGRNPFQGLTLPQVPRKRRVIVQHHQLRQFLDAAMTERQYAFFVIALTCGLRPSEIRGLQWTDLKMDADEPCLHVERNLQHVRAAVKLALPDKVFVGPPKTASSERIVPLIPFAVEVLRGHQLRMTAEQQRRLAQGKTWPNPELVFTTAHGTPENENVLSVRVFPRILARAGLPRMDFYSLRRAFVTHLLELGVDLKTTSEMAGHSDIGVTGNIYAQVTGSSVRRMHSKLDELYSGLGLTEPTSPEVTKVGRSDIH